MTSTQQASLLAALEHERGWRQMLQSKLSNAEPALQQANQQLESARIEAEEGVRAAARNARICTALQERLLELEESTRKAEEQRASDASAAAARLTDLHSAFTASLDRASQARDALAQQLRASMQELEAVRQAREASETAAADRMRQRAAEFEEALATAVAARVALEERIAALQTEIDAGEARRESERGAERERRAAREAEFAAELAQVTDDRDALAVELRDAAFVIEQSRRQQGQDAAEIERLARREAQLLDQLAHEGNARTLLEQQNDRVTTELRETKERHMAELATATSQLAARDATIDTRDAELATLQADTMAMRTTLEASLDDAGRALQRAEHVADLERRAASARERSLEDAIARETAGRTAAEAALGVARAAFAQGRRRLLNAASALRRRSAARRSALEQEIAQQRSSFEQQVGALGTSLVDTEREVAELRTTLDTSRADLHALNETREHEHQEFEQTRSRDRSEIERVNTEHRQTRDALDQLRAAFNTLEQVSSEHALERARLEGVVTDQDARISAHEAATYAAEQQTDRVTTELRETKERYIAELATATSQLAARDADVAARDATIDARDAELAALQADTMAMRTTLEASLDDAGRALQRAEHVADLERLAASARERSLEDAIARETAGRTAAEGALGVARAAFAQGRRRLLNAASALRHRSAARRSALEQEIAQQRSSFEQQIGVLGTSLVETEREVAELRTTLDASRADLHALGETRRHEHQEFEQTRSRDRSEIERVTAEHQQAREALDQLRAAFNTLEQVSSAHALERARLEGVVTDRDARISAQEAAARAAEQSGKDTLHRVEAELHHIIDGKTTDIAALESDLHGVRGDLQRVTQDADALRIDANRVPSLMRQIESARQDARQQFERSPSALLRAGRDGSLMDVNPSLARLLGYRTTADCAALELEGFFHSPADMHWLLEHAGGNHPEPIETIWKKKDRSRLTVRVRVVRTKEEWIEFAVEDVTRLRALEEDLQHARRMESVGRLASEVATTCDSLLRSVSQSGRQWMSALESDARLREQSERLVGDVDHAVSLLQHFTAYGHEQAAAGEAVDLRRVFNNLAPVLKRVAGDDIELVLPKHIRHFDVDVERARVERVLINVASYARERMPQGGRLKIDLAPTVVDREFLQKYPNVRPGAHVLATVTEERSTMPRGHASEIVTGPSAPVATARPALDLSILVRILGECGGHLWVTAEPSGNMTLKIHLPLRAAADAEAVTSSSLATAPLARTLGRWFRH